MKACVIQPPYSMDIKDADRLFEQKLEYLRKCDDSMDIIVLPEYSDVPCKTVAWEDTYALHSKYIGRLLDECAETARRCNAILFVNALSLTDTGYRNTTYAFDRSGNIVGKYFKKHLPPSELFDLHLDSDYTRVHSEPYVLELEGLRFAFLTCYDFYFYEAFASIARQNVDIIIGCSLQRSDTHSALEIMGRFCAYNCNAHLVRASVSLSPDSEICGASMIVTPKGDMLVNMKSETGLATAEFDPADKYYKPAGFGGKLAPHYEYIEFGRNPWQYRPGGSAIAKPDAIMPYPRLCAHRGFSSVAPENSMPAFGAAVGMGADEIEFDLWYTKDGEVVSIHDSTLERVSDGSGFIYDHTLAELEKLDFGAKFGEKFKGLKIVRFEEILKKFACHVVMNIHIKPDCTNDFEYEMLQKIIALIDKYDCRKYVYLASCEKGMLEKFRAIAPDIPKCFIVFSAETELVEKALKYGCSKIQFYKNNFNPDIIEIAHSKGIRCNMFWSDDSEEAIKFLDMGIDTILTNDFGIVSAAIKERLGK